MTNATSFTQRHNAKRAAERMITVGIAPSIDYGLRENEEGRFEIVWKTATPEPPFDDDGCSDETFAALIAEPEADPAPPAPHFSTLPDPWPTGSRVKIRMAPRSKTGVVVERVSSTHWSVHLDFTAPGEVEHFDDEEMASAAASVTPRPIAPPRETAGAKMHRHAKAEIDARAGAGELPTKPIITSKTNAGYQKRFDKVEAFALAGNWDGVRDYAINGVNSYAKMLRDYRERVLAAHAASVSSRAA